MNIRDALVGIGIALALLLSIVSSMHAAVSQDAYGWTIVTPSADTRIIYVSSSEGDDTNDGLSRRRRSAPLHMLRTMFVMVIPIICC